MKIKRYSYIVLTFIFMFLIACGKGRGKVTPVKGDQVSDLSPSQGGSIVLAMGNIDTLNPLLNSNQDYYHISKLLYDHLFVVQKNGKIVPSLAEHYSLSEDGHTLSVTIRDNIYWEDGKKLTAKDVAATFNALQFLPEESPYFQLIKHSVTSAQSFNIKDFARAIVFDDKNIDFQFKKPYGNILQMLTFPVLPSHLMTPEEMVSKDKYRVNGTGPFLLKSYERNKEIVLMKNPNYHQNVPFVDEVRIKIMGDKNKEKQAFEAGQLDVLCLGDYTWDKYRANSDIKIENIETNKLEILAFNMTNPIFQGEEGLALRQAIHRSINKEKIIDSLYLSQGSSSSSLINKELSAGLSLENEVYYNLETSEGILQKAHFHDFNGDGWLEKPNGERFQLEISANLSNYLKKTEAELIVEDLKALGIRASVKDVNSLEGEKKSTNLVLNGDYQLALFEINFSAVPDISSLLYGDSSSFQNISRVNDPILNEYLVELSLTYDEGTRSLLLNKIHNRFLEICPYIPLFFKQEVLVRNAKIKEGMNPIYFDRYSGIKNVHVPRK